MAGKPRHGMSRTKLYQRWCGMKNRCNTPSYSCYHRYGGRGITYCKEWENFEPFMEWALNNGYSDDLTLDRINNDGNYCPENCRWTTQHEQSMNKTHLPNKTGYVGVKAHFRTNVKGEKVLDGYSCYINRNRKEKYIGHALTAEEASKIREQYLLELENGNSD